MKPQIKNRFTNETICEGEENETLRDLAIRKIAERANLWRADLQGANLWRANLWRANLWRADLWRADLQGANLQGANLWRADLQGANLQGANLQGANLWRANLPSPTMVLLATWGDLSQQLCADLMLFDSQNHPNPTVFDDWASGSGNCPYSGAKVQRAANFSERKEFWGQGIVCRPYDLMTRVLAEKCPEWSEEKRAEFEVRFKKEEK